MPYAPGIAYRGDQYLYQGLTSAVDRIEREREKAKQDKKLHDSYITQGKAMGLNPDVLRNAGLGGAAGMVEGEKLKRLQEHRDIANRYQQTQTEALNQQIANYGQIQQRAQEEWELRMKQIRADMEARERHAAALKQFGGRFAELSSQPDPAVMAALRAQQEALGAMGGVGVPPEALAEYATKRQLTGQEIGLEGIKAGLDPQALASFIHYVAPQGQQGGKLPQIWEGQFSTGQPARGVVHGNAFFPAAEPPRIVSLDRPDGRTVDVVAGGRGGQTVIKDRTAIEEELAAARVANEKLKAEMEQLRVDMVRQMRPGATNAPAAKAPAAGTQTLTTDKQRLLKEAKEAIRLGAPADQVKARLERHGITME